MFYPRSGPDTESWSKAEQVWCSSDRQQALTDAKKGMALKKRNCTNPVTMDYNLASTTRTCSTPAIFAADCASAATS